MTRDFWHPTGFYTYTARGCTRPSASWSARDYAFVDATVGFCSPIMAAHPGWMHEVAGQKPPDAGEVSTDAAVEGDRRQRRQECLAHPAWCMRTKMPTRGATGSPGRRRSAAAGER
jgi:hypothetical protein